MTNTWFIADTHFGHRNIINFKDNKGNPLRPFKDGEEMDETLIHNWNECVQLNDKIYHLGDVVINRKSLKLLERCNGRKVLIRGNHDIFKLKDYAAHFDDVRAYKVMPKHGLIFSHIPLHPGCLSCRGWINIHGHLHSNHIKRGDDLDERYLNICVEQTGFKPISFDEILGRVNELRLGVDEKDI